MNKQRERRYCARIERELAARGVRKPYMTLGEWVYHNQCALGQNFEIDSYPLTAYARAEFDATVGAVYHVTIKDCSLTRIGQDALIAERRIDACGNVVGGIAAILTQLHPEAYERAKRQEENCIARLKASYTAINVAGHKEEDEHV